MKNSQLRFLNKFTSLSPRLTIISVTILLTNRCFAQQFNNWYFPVNAGISFNTNPSSPLLDGKAIYGSAATISDATGNLLFYSDGLNVYNKLHLVMNNGDSLRNEGNQSGGLVILPFLDGSNKYYLFNSASVGYNEYLFDGFTYNVINMDSFGGLGEVEQKDVRLGSHNSSEKVSIAKHGNGVDAWLITRDRGNSFFTYKITCTGIDTVPVISILGINTILDTLGNVYSYGAIKVSPDGKIIAAAYNNGYTAPTLELYRFDNLTGILSTPITIDSITNPFGVELQITANCCMQLI